MSDPDPTATEPTANTAAADKASKRKRAAVLSALPERSIMGQSPLQHLALPGHSSVDSQGDLRFCEVGLLGHLILRCRADDAAQLAAFERVMGIALPTAPLQSIETPAYIVRWLSPDEWLITVPALQTCTLEQRLRDEIPGHFALVDSSGGLTLYQLAGPQVVNLLKKCVAVDLHPQAFPVGKVVSTVFAKHQVILRRRETDAFELLVRRSYADYVWRWISDASAEFGLTIES
jgi:sarcosine oxidase subunit gamma